MNQSKSDISNISPTSCIYTSIFYARDKWHELLPVIQDALTGQDEFSPYVFFSSHRGSSIRLALRYNDVKLPNRSQQVIKKINEFISEHPSEPSPLQLPITGFFSDFPNNEIKFNLYNERVFASGALAQFQLVLSQTLLSFFEGHPVDDDALFTLVVWLDEAILTGLANLDDLKVNLILKLISETKKRIADPAFELIQLEGIESFLFFPSFDGRQALNDLSLWITYAAAMLKTKTGSESAAYFILQSIIREHLFRLPNEIFVDSLEYLVRELMSVNSMKSLQESVNPGTGTTLLNN